ncbi:hypothetical protein HPC49_11945 [Pyxidicoccus fallax]|uniref:BACON domain-containing protein n=1 Tax=Pyxidicoccus fallax TaxID=394095 RepID=A0A848LE60_9BACT|nr:hypothetical protein [Pyxidicoccus fallax]NMO17329.1 hypothetical protein [Pyxidicoccus fallax]NPC78952.1 hypothetical protein [Pyxidicoccus fallax]
MNTLRGKCRGTSLLVLGLSLILSSACSEEVRLTVEPSSLSFEATEGDYSEPAPKLLTGQLLNLGEDQRVFLSLVHTNNGLQRVEAPLTNPSPIKVYPKQPTRGGDTHQDVVVIAACEDADCKHHFPGSPATIPVTYSIKGRLRIDNGIPHDRTFHQVVGDVPPPAVPIELQGFERSWKAETNQKWLKLSASSGQTPATLMLSVEPNTLPEGTHLADVFISDAETLQTWPVHVRLTKSLPYLQVAGEELRFADKVDGVHPRRQLFVTMPVATASPWTATIDHGDGPRWLKLSAMAGTTQPNPTAPLEAFVDETDLPPGEYRATVTFTATVEGQTLTQVRQAELRHHLNQLRVNRYGVALMRTPSRSRLSESIPILEGSGSKTTTWTASANQDWLSVTPRGTTGSNLTLTANPAGLAPDIVHVATVTVRSLETVNEHTLQVGFWVGASDAVNPVTVPSVFRAVEVDPIRPYAYVHDGATLFVHNLYTGARVATLDGLGTASGGLGLGGMAVSSDGSVLYVVDGDARQVVPIRLSTLTPGTRWGLDTGTSQNLTYVRPSGVGLLIAGDGHIYDADTGARLPTSSPFAARDTLSASLNPYTFCTLGACTQDSCGPSRCYFLGFFSHDDLSVIPHEELSADATAVAVNPSGTRIYVASGPPYEFQVLNRGPEGPLPSLHAGAPPNGLVIDVDERVYGSAYTRTGPADVWIYDRDGAALGTLRLGNSTAGIRDGQLKVSGDGRRLVALTEDSLKIVSTP